MLKLQLQSNGSLVIADNRYQVYYDLQAEHEYAHHPSEVPQQPT